MGEFYDAPPQPPSHSSGVFPCERVFGKAKELYEM